jgi:hypothetical protein
MELETARAKAAQLLGAATQSSHTGDLVDVQDGVTGAHTFMVRKTPAGFAVPAVLYFGLTQLLDLQEGERGDKVVWTIPFEYKGVQFAFELRKSGLRFMCDRERILESLVAEVVGRARSLCRIAAQHLDAEHVPPQLKSGNVTFPNYFGALEHRYRFFRAQAEASFAAVPVVTADNARDIDAAALSEMLDRAGDIATACIDAYFSRIEHLLILSVAFTGDVVDRGELLEFLRASWTTKVCTQLKPGEDAELGNLYEELVTIRREWRNPWAHGGFKSGGASFYFHVTGVGVLPVALSWDERRILDLATPEHSFTRAVEAFDAFDRLLRQGKLEHAFRWAESGLDLAVDAESRADIRAAMRSREAFDAFVDGVALRRDMEANVEF